MTLQSPLPILFSTEPTKKFAEEVARQLGVPLSDSGFVRFASTEIKVALEESVRGENVFVFGTHDAPVHDSIMQQLILIDAAKRASATQVTAVCPYLGYGRQDRKSKGREPITSKLLCDMLRVAGADRIVTIDMHSGQSQGFFDGPFDHLIAMPAIERHIRENCISADTKPIMVSPDAGRTKQTERYANRLGLDMAIVHKDRKATNKATAIALMGDVKGRHCIINDDMIDTAGTIVSAAELLKSRGATTVSVVATHGLFSDPAAERLAGSAIDRIAVTDSLPLGIKLPSPQIDVMPVTDIFADAIRAIHENGSVSQLFDGENNS